VDGFPAERGSGHRYPRTLEQVVHGGDDRRHRLI
jgi:hypothetical protein